MPCELHRGQDVDPFVHLYLVQPICTRFATATIQETLFLYRGSEYLN